MNLFFSRSKHELLTHPLPASSPSLSVCLWTCCQNWAVLPCGVTRAIQTSPPSFGCYTSIRGAWGYFSFIDSYIFCGPGHFGHVTLISLGRWLLETCLMIQWGGAGILLFFSSALAWDCQKIFALRIIVWIIFKALERVLLTLRRQYKTFSMEEWGWRSIFQERSYIQTSVLKV